MAAAAPHISALPEPALRGILLTAVQTDDLLRYVAACARVCAEWRRVVAGSAAYGRGLGAGEARARVLRAIVKALEADSDELNLSNQYVGDAGAAALGAALQALPTIRFTGLHLGSNELTAEGVASVAPALRRPWGGGGRRELFVSGNRGLGDAGVAALAKALPPSLTELFISDTGCGDDGLVALAAALPALTRLEYLHCSDNPAAGDRGWAALAGALPSLPALQAIRAYASDSHGMGSEGAVALAAALPRCPRLRDVFVMRRSELAARTEPGFVALYTALQQLPAGF